MKQTPSKALEEKLLSIARAQGDFKASLVSLGKSIQSMDQFCRENKADYPSTLLSYSRGYLRLFQVFAQTYERLTQLEPLFRQIIVYAVEKERKIRRVSSEAKKNTEPYDDLFSDLGLLFYGVL